MPNLIKKVQNTIFEQNIFARGSKIMIACSGGPDSASLLDVFFKIREKYGLGISIAHVNYGLRGKESDRDEKFVKDLAEKYDCRIFILRPEIKSKKNLENALREIRYGFFEKIRKENNFDYVAVGHTLDDQAETYLMRIIRGAGLSGLSSMAYKNGRIIRPLLNIPRNEIIAHLEKNNLSFRTDKTNLESSFLRNKIRNKLIPFIENKFNPNIKRTIFDAAESARNDYDFISKISAREFRNNRELSIKKLIALHPSIQAELVKTAIARIKRDLKDIESAHIREIIKIIRSAKNKSQFTKFGGLKIARKGDKLLISLMKK